jgi:chemotaxis protein methyltransferase CheR
MPRHESEPCSPLRASEFAKIRRLAYETFGLDLRSGKETLVAARLSKQMRDSAFRSFDDYYRHVVEDTTGEALTHLIDCLTTNHTSFFREPAHFDFLRKTFLPEWKSRHGLKIWSAACSTGEEPYSIALCLIEELGPGAGKARILATDISTRVLAAAKKGIYSADRMSGISEAMLRRYCLRGEQDWEGSYRVKKELRDLVDFERVNLLDPQAQTRRFPLIFCRNVMIYFDKPTQQRAIDSLVRSLEPGGYLLTGHAESLNGIDHGLQYVQPAIYRKPGTESKSRWKTC